MSEPRTAAPEATHPRSPRAVFARAACFALLMVVGANALSLPGRRLVGRYDFGYAIRGDLRARPAQVFDDGAGKLYFQPRPGLAMPAVFTGKEPQLLVLQPEGQYFTARTGASDFTLALGAARASVRRGDAALGGETLEPESIEAEPPVSPTPMDAGDDTPAFRTLATPWIDRRVAHAQPIVFAAGSAVPTPEVRAALSALVARIGRGVGIVVEGRGDAGAHDAHDALARARALALRHALIARGVAPADVEIREGATSTAATASTIRWTTTVPRDLAPLAAAATPPIFDIDPADGDIAGTLRRWARASGYDVVWDVGWTAPVNGSMRVAATTFVDAVRAVAAGLRAQGYPVQAQAYADRVVRFAAVDRARATVAAAATTTAMAATTTTTDSGEMAR